MIIKSIRIRNFKSIKDITVPIKSYGEGVNKSNTIFFVGINESGKSTILEAISLINEGFENIDYEDYCYLESQDNNEYIYIGVLLDDVAFLQKNTIEELNLHKEFVDLIEILNIEKNIYKNNTYCWSTYNITINDSLPYFEYIINKEQKTVSGTAKSQTVETIQKLSEFNNIEETITPENAKTFLKENQELLTKSKLEKKIAGLLRSTLDNNMPKIQMWRPSPKYLINETIDLENFKEDPNISIPLKNVFLINGITTNEEIKNSIERALADQAKCDALKDKMEEATTKYINKIWKEHNIKIKLSINATNCEVHIEDKDKKFVYYTMAQRSDGFKQFISLIFSLSAQNKGDILKNNLILIDEPEIHLHPSGIQYMRDEILKIGKNNYVFVATHSNYMIDSNARERYWIVEKEKSETKITQVNEDYNFTDNKVLSPAFGLNIFKELLPKNIILVEGENDKNIILHAINLLNKTFFCSIKEVGGASKMPIFARLLQEEKITPFILLDADKEGNECKKKILDEQRDFYSDLNVFTLKDLLSDLPKEATIEDLLPIDFVKSFSDCEMEDSFDLKDNDTIIHQLKRQNEKLQEDKYKLNSLKTKLAISFCNKYKTKFEEKVPKLALAVNVLFKKINEYYELQ